VIDNSSVNYGFDVSGASYVTIQGFTVDSTATNPILVSDSNYVTVDSTTVYGGKQNLNPAAILVYGASASNDTVSRNVVHGYKNGYGIYVDSGGSDNVVTTNLVTGAVSNGIINFGSADATIVSNTVVGYCGIGMESGGNEFGAGLNATIENNVISGESCAGSVALTWGENADASVADYNVVHATDSGTFPYEVNGTTYNTSAALNAATGQGAHDLNSDPGISATGTITSATSPLIDSANSSAPGELSTDIVGNARVDDPLVANTGVGTYAYYDRGAYEYEDPIAIPDYVIKDVSTLTVGYEAGVLNTSWGSTTVKYDFGDGSAPVTAAAGVMVNHTYPKPGTTYTIISTATDTAGNSATGTNTWTTSGSDYTAFGPTRILDTRTGLGRGGVKHPLGSNTYISLQIGGNGSIPSNVTAVVLNFTATNATGGGNITAYPVGSVPKTSTLNYGTGTTVANEAIVPVASDGYISIYDTGATDATTVDLIADVTGYFTQSASSGYTPLAPARILDTRSGTGAPKAKVAAQTSIPLTIDGADSGALPATGITAVALHVTETDATGGAFLTVYPDGEDVPSTSSLNFATGSTVSNTVIVPVSDGAIRLYNGALSGSIDVIADVEGYYSTDSTGAYVPVAPTRIVDTRTSTAMSNGSKILVTPSSLDSAIPSTADAYAANLTVTAPTASGVIIAYPAGSTQPSTSNLNYGKGQTIAGLSQVSAGSSGSFVVLNQEVSGTVQMIVDVSGYYTSH
jgi:hypothetical protein